MDLNSYIPAMICPHCRKETGAIGSNRKKEIPCAECQKGKTQRPYENYVMVDETTDGKSFIAVWCDPKEYLKRGERFR